MRRFVLAWISLGCCAGVAIGDEPPRVVVCEPASGERAVDPTRTELRVVFDREMLTDRYSFMTGDAVFPQTTGKARWLDERTCVLPVELQPATEYFVGINTGAGSGFQDRDGTPAAPFEWRFRTAGQRSPTAEGTVVVQRLRQVIRDRYSYVDRVVLDWDALFAEYQPALSGARSIDEFAAAAVKMLAATEDPHVQVAVGDRQVQVYPPRFERNYDVDGIRAFVPGFRYLTDVVASGRFDDGIGYVLIATWSRARADELRSGVDTLFTELADAPAIVVDLRANGGGDEALAREFAGRFVAEKVVYAKQVFRDPEAEGGWSEISERVLEPFGEADARFRGRVAVLHGRNTMSSSEAAVLMMRVVPGAVTLGQPTYGASGNPRRYDLGNGVAIYVPSWKSMDAEGEPFEGIGIAPDIEVDATPAELAVGDPVIARALEVIRRTETP